MQSDIEILKAENDHLRKLLGLSNNVTTSRPLKKAYAAQSSHQGHRSKDHAAFDTCPATKHTWEATSHDLSKDQIPRYSRQLILPSFGPAGESEKLPCGTPMKKKRTT